MFEKKDFKSFYDELYSDILDEYYQEMDDEKTRNLLLFFIVIGILAFIPTIICWIFFYEINYLFFFIVVTLTYNLGVIIYFYASYRHSNKELLKKVKRQILDDLIIYASKDGDAKVLPFNRVSKSSFVKTELFNINELEYNGSNYIKVQIGKNDIVLSDIELFYIDESKKQEYFYVGNRKFLRTYHIKKRKDIFTGCYIGSDMKKDNDINIKVIPKDWKIPKKYYLIDDQKINLESSEFSNKYDVYSNDEIKSRLIITPPLMEKISTLDKILTNKKIFIFKPDGRYTIFIKNFSIDEILEKYVPYKRKKKKEYNNMYNIYKNLHKLFITCEIINT